MLNVPHLASRLGWVATTIAAQVNTAETLPLTHPSSIQLDALFIPYQSWLIEVWQLDCPRVQGIAQQIDVVFAHWTFSTPLSSYGILQITHLGPSLRTTIGSFKSAVTRLSHKKYLPSKQELWQRGYFDHIVRSETSLLRLRQYILDNPIKWHLDELHPLHPQPGRCMGIAPTSK